MYIVFMDYSKRKANGTGKNINAFRRKALAYNDTVSVILSFSSEKPLHRHGIKIVPHLYDVFL